MSLLSVGICLWCGVDTTWGSGNFVNRIPADQWVALSESSEIADAEIDGWMCAQCLNCHVCGACSNREGCVECGTNRSEHDAEDDDHEFVKYCEHEKSPDGSLVHPDGDLCINCIKESRGESIFDLQRWVRAGNISPLNERMNIIVVVC